MALSPSFSLAPSETDGTILIITDSTGTYDASTNTGGYGSPNPESTDIHWYHILKVKTKGQGLTFDETEKSLVTDDSTVLTSTDQVAYTTVDLGGLFTLLSYGVLIYDAEDLSTYTEGQILWDSDQGKYVIITSGSPVVISWSSIDTTTLAYQVTSYVFYPVELNKLQGKMLQNLPATNPKKIETWVIDWMELEKDFQIIKLEACRKFYNSALLILAEYQNKIVSEDC